jgi:hypothetical protein
LPSSAHTELYLKLEDVIAQAKTALAADDTEKLPDILQMHRDVMTEIGAAGDCNDPELIEHISGILNTVRYVEKELKQKQLVLENSFAIARNKRKIARAYGP